MLLSIEKEKFDNANTPRYSHMDSHGSAYEEFEALEILRPIVGTWEQTIARAYQLIK
jgi:hypothetical protein